MLLLTAFTPGTTFFICICINFGFFFLNLCILLFLNFIFALVHKLLLLTTFAPGITFYMCICINFGFLLLNLYRSTLRLVYKLLSSPLLYWFYLMHLFHNFWLILQDRGFNYLSLFFNLWVCGRLQRGFIFFRFLNRLLRVTFLSVLHDLLSWV